MFVLWAWPWACSIGRFWWFINAFNVQMKNSNRAKSTVQVVCWRQSGASSFLRCLHMWALSRHVMSFWKASCFQQYRNQTGSPANQSPTSPVSNQGFSPGGSPQVRVESPLTMFACCAFGRSPMSQLSVLPPTLLSVCISNPMLIAQMTRWFLSVLFMYLLLSLFWAKGMGGRLA